MANIVELMNDNDISKVPYVSPSHTYVKREIGKGEFGLKSGIKFYGCSLADYRWLSTILDDELHGPYVAILSNEGDRKINSFDVWTEVFAGYEVLVFPCRKTSSGFSIKGANLVSVASIKARNSRSLSFNHEKVNIFIGDTLRDARFVIDFAIDKDKEG